MGDRYVDVKCTGATGLEQNEGSKYPFRRFDLVVVTATDNYAVGDKLSCFQYLHDGDRAAEFLAKTAQSLGAKSGDPDEMDGLGSIVATAKISLNTYKGKKSWQVGGIFPKKAGKTKAEISKDDREDFKARLMSAFNELEPIVGIPAPEVVAAPKVEF